VATFRDHARAQGPELRRSPGSLATPGHRAQNYDDARSFKVPERVRLWIVRVSHHFNATQNSVGQIGGVAKRGSGRTVVQL
jgi:hypothetical protein